MEDFRDQGESPLLLEEDQRTEDEARQEMATRDVWSAQLSQVQAVALLMAHVLSLVAVVVVISWVYMLGGLSWKQGESKRVFNWHPLLMTVAFFFMTVASLSFRYRHSSRKLLKFTHGTAWAVAALCSLVALIAVFRSHNDLVSGFIANLYSLHSWVGCAVIGMYALQFAVGIVSFAWPLSNMTPILKARLLTFHRFFGPIIYNGVAATILLGIQEKEGFIGCAYTVSEADTFPLNHFWEIPASCRVSHLLGILVLAVAFCTNLACHNFVTAAGRHTL